MNCSQFGKEEEAGEAAIPKFDRRRKKDDKE